jgi:uncharacterized membrane protein YhhN
MAILLFALFGITSIIHLIVILLKRERARILTKALIMPLLGLWYFFSTHGPLATMCLAFFFCWGGDLFLIKKKKLSVLFMGLLSFLLGHVCYIISMMGIINSFHAAIFIISVLVIIPLAVLDFKIINFNKKLLPPVIVYCIVIIAMVLCAEQVLLNAPGVPGLLVFAGALCFVASDSLLSYFTFRGMTRGANFAVMAAYIAAQAGIAAGIGMIYKSLLSP